MTIAKGAQATRWHVWEQVMYVIRHLYVLSTNEKRAC